MASIYKRKNKDGTSCWRVVIRIKGYPAVCNHFDRKQEADDWAADVERQIRLGQYKSERMNASHTFSDLIDHFLASGAVEHHKSAEDTIRHLQYWKQRLAGYALVHLDSEFIAKERRLLQDTPSHKGTPRSPATINRYLSSLSTLFSYACRELRWLSDNPCALLVKLKEAAGRDRVLSEYELDRLLVACRDSRSPYLYCVVLIALTTGARQGEILNLQWQDIDFDNRLAFLKATKNGRPRSISLTDAVVDELRKIHSTRNPSKPLVFASKTAFGRVDLKKAWQHALSRAGIANCRAHDMRHTFCTLAARQGASNLELATATGHRTLQMLQRYTHLDAQVTRKFSNQISEQILEGMSS